MTAPAEVYGPHPLKEPFRTGETVSVQSGKFNVEVGLHTVCLQAIDKVNLSWITNKIHRLTERMPAFGELCEVSGLDALVPSIIVPTTQGITGFREKELVQAGAFNWQFLLTSSDPRHSGNTPTAEYVSYLPPGFFPVSNDPVTRLHDLIDHGPETKRLPHQSVNSFRFLCQDAQAMLAQDPQAAEEYQDELVDALDILTDPGLSGFVDEGAKGKLVTWLMHKVGIRVQERSSNFTLIQERARKIIDDHPVLDAAGNSVNILEWEAGPELGAHYERVDRILRLPPKITAAQLHLESMALSA